MDVETDERLGTAGEARLEAEGVGWLPVEGNEPARRLLVQAVAGHGDARHRTHEHAGPAPLREAEREAALPGGGAGKRLDGLGGAVEEPVEAERVGDESSGKLSLTKSPLTLVYERTPIRIPAMSTIKGSAAAAAVVPAPVCGSSASSRMATVEATPASSQSRAWLFPSVIVFAASSSRRLAVSGGERRRKRFLGYAAAAGKSPTTVSRLSERRSAARKSGASAATTARALAPPSPGVTLAVSSELGSM
jgi:hypothetical protein